MARTRSIKPGLYTNEAVADCSFPARYLFPGLWTIADREGRIEDKPRTIKARLLPFDDVDCEELLAELHQAGLVKRYEVSGVKVLQINNFVKHQRPHPSEPPSELPDALTTEQDFLTTEQEQNTTEPENKTATCAFSLLPSPFNPSPFNPSLDNASQEKFRQFWEAYPCDKDGKKVGVEDCRMAYLLLPPHQQDQVLTAVSHYAQSSRAKDGYATKPIKFLDSGWPDWLEPAKPHPPPNGENKVLSREGCDEMNRRHAENNNRHRKPRT